MRVLVPMARALMHTSPVYSKLRPAEQSPVPVLLSPQLVIPATKNPKKSLNLLGEF